MALMLQQCLPLTVLKLDDAFDRLTSSYYMVATVLTAYGIETAWETHQDSYFMSLQQCLPLTVLKLSITHFITPYYLVATVLTAYGIETQYLLHE